MLRLHSLKAIGELMTRVVVITGAGRGMGRR